MTEGTKEQIAALQKIVRNAQIDADAAYATKYETEAEIARLRGDVLDAEWNAALARVYAARRDGADTDEMAKAEAEKDRAYIRVQASHHLNDAVPDLSSIAPGDRAAVLAEIERMKAEQVEGKD